ncbi:MAG: hypothetical protein AAGC95_00240 [Pseudomonadota bacterium]
MANDIIDLDHLMFNCFSAERTERRLNQMGFKVRGFRPIPPMGGGDAGGSGGSLVVMFKGANDACANFLEFSVCDHAFAHPVMRGILKGAEGVGMAVLATDQPDILHKRWAEQKGEVEHWKFMFPGGDDDTPPIKVAIVLPHAGVFPWPINAVWQDDYSSYYNADLQDHPNTTLRMSAVTYVTLKEQFNRDVAGVSAAYGSGMREAKGAEWVEFTPGKTCMRITTTEMLHKRWPVLSEPVAVRAPCAAVISFDVRDLQVLKSTLTDNGIEWKIIDGAVCTHPGDSLNTIFEFKSVS